MVAMPFSTIVFTCAYALAALAGWRFYRHRCWVNRLRKEGVPMPAWSWITGNLFYFIKHNKGLPPLASVNLAFLDMSAAFKDEEMFLIDIWPLSEPMLVIFNPEAAIQVCQKLNLPKGRKNETMIRPITGGMTLLSMNGADWKIWRNLFSPGFSTSVMADQVPTLVDFVLAFCEKLKTHAGKGIVCLDELTTQLTFEIILKISLNSDLGVDYENHVFVRAMDKVIKWHSFWDPLVLANPLRPFVNWYNGRIVNRWIQSELQDRYETLKDERKPSKITNGAPQTRAKSVMDLAIEGYIDSNGGVAPAKLDASFLQTATHQMRLFLFAGNDTTSSTIVFAFYLLAKYPKVLAQLRNEHDSIFSPDAAATAQQIKDDPSLLNKCKLTLAVIKETLRLYAPAASMRTGNPDCTLKTQSGIPVPTDGIALLIQHHATHRNPRVWLHPDEFLPERWLVGPEHHLAPKTGAWRPFELGPRNCIGQTLSMNEIKVVLVMTIRFFEIAPAYEEFDRLRHEKGGWSGTRKPSIYRGERAYQTEKAGAHPSDGYPSYVSIIPQSVASVAT